MGSALAGRPVLTPDSPPAGACAVIALGGSRREHWTRLQGCGWSSRAVVHPRAHVSPSARLGAGCIVAPGAVVGAETIIGEHTLVSRGTRRLALLYPFSRESTLAVMPSSATARPLGMGAVIVNATKIGADATVAAGAVVLRDVGAGSRVQGVPAREYRG